MTQVIIAGDFAPTLCNQELIANEPTEVIFGDRLLQLLRESECNIINLETSLTVQSTPKIKRGQINKTIPEVCSALSKANIKLCCLANNHIIDNGNQGMLSTFQALETQKINYIGAGKTLAEAQMPYVFSYRNRKIKILNIANYEFNKITNDEYGVNVYDPLETFDYIRSQANEDSYLIVVFHGGVEYYQYPSPELQRICRKMVDCGAAVVTCQHSHCIGTYENYKSSLIMYGQGNFLFDDSDKELEKTAILLKIDIESGDVSFVPVVKDGCLVRMADSNEAEIIIDGIKKRHDEIQTPNFVSKRWKEFCKSETRAVLNAFTGNNVIYRIVNKITRGRLQSIVFNSKNKMRLYNMLSSPALLEVVQGVTSEYEDER